MRDDNDMLHRGPPFFIFVCAPWNRSALVDQVNDHDNHQASFQFSFRPALNRSQLSLSHFLYFDIMLLHITGSSRHFLIIASSKLINSRIMKLSVVFAFLSMQAVQVLAQDTALSQPPSSQPSPAPSPFPSLSPTSQPSPAPSQPPTSQPSVDVVRAYNLLVCTRTSTQPVLPFAYPSNPIRWFLLISC